MIIELSKDKNLLNILSKVDLDPETKKLVEGKASISIIKMSLERNLNASNIVEYRRYITKADEDLIDEDEEQEEDYVPAKERKKQETANLEAATYGEARSHQKVTKKASKELSFYNSAIGHLESMSTDIRVIEKEVRHKRTGKARTTLQVINGRDKYRFFASTIIKSEQILDLFQSLKGNPKFLTEYYSRYLTDGQLLGQNFATNEDGSAKSTENKNKDVDVNKLQERFNALLALEFAVKDKKISFTRAIELQHIQLYTKEPKNTVDRTRRKNELKRMQYQAKGSNPQVHQAYERELRALKASIGSVTKIQVTKTHLEEKLGDLETIMNDSDKLIARKMQRLVRALATLMNSKEFDLTLEAIKEKTTAITDLQKNPKKYIKEAKAELEEDLEKEAAKIEQLVSSLRVFEEIKPHLKGLTRIINMFEETLPIDIVKQKITQGAALIIKIKRTAVKMEVLSSRADESIGDGFIELLSDTDVALTIDSEGIDWGGLPTVDMSDMDSMDRLTDTMQTLVTNLESIVNELNSMISGTDSEPISEDDQQFLDEDGEIEEAARKEKVQSMRDNAERWAKEGREKV